MHNFQQRAAPLRNVGPAKRQIARRTGKRIQVKTERTLVYFRSEKNFAFEMSMPTYESNIKSPLVIEGNAEP